MERESRKNGLVIWILLAGLVSQNVVMPVMGRSLEGVKNKNCCKPDPYPGSPPPKSSPDPYTGSPPPKSSPDPYNASPPPKRSHKSPTCGTPPPPPPPRCKTPPSPPPCGGSGGSPPPVHHSPPTYGQSPPTPTYQSPPTYGQSPPTPTYQSPPTYGQSPPVLTPPSIDPTTPPTPVTTPSSPPLIPDPNTPPFTCDYWKTHPQLIWGLFGFWGTVGGAFGVAGVPAFAPNLSLQQALGNTRNDGFGSLYREGTASLLNSMVNKNFVFTAQQVRERFTAALVSDKVAAAQAKVFKKANEGRLNIRE